MNSKTNHKPILWRLRPTERRLILIVIDLFLAIVALSISLYIWAQQDAWLDFSLEFLTNRIPMWFYLLPFIWVLLLIEIYDLKRASRRGDTIRGVAIAAAISLVFYLLIYYQFGWSYLSTYIRHKSCRCCLSSNTVRIISIREIQTKRIMMEVRVVECE